MILRKCMGVGIAERQQSENLLRSDERNAQPRPQVCMSSKGGPLRLLGRIRHQHTTLCHKKMGVRRIECVGTPGRAPTGIGVLYLALKKEMGIRFKQ